MASINHLYEEIIIKILSWLPVLSLLKCKSVCKLWKSIISDPHFIQAHLTISHNKPAPFSLLRVVSGGTLRDFFIDTRGENSKKLTLPEYMSGMLFYVRSCNGLVTLANMNVGVLYIWNPLTRLFKLLPKPKRNPLCFFDLGFANNLGFGFDSVSYDYKILRVVFGGFACGVDEVFVVVVELYSVNADCWREIEVPEEMQGFKCYRFSRCVCVGGGVLYFEGMDGIMSFDLHDEVFGLCRYPDEGERMSDVLEFDGSVAVIFKSGRRGSVYSLWKLDGDGGNFSWTKMFKIEPDVKIDYVLLYLGDGQFFAKNYGVGYFFYDIRKNGDKKFPPLACPIRECMSAIQFTGSLVSLEGFERRE
ncbi:hypothetical protein POM88_051616 [Heracleum sosnowskyi]|uniref:F-box domain-containing protein n=1 Tax=Heracleum sosnowskyi TaxID=360622 RepID=A0AAD8H2A7_9APIA|nr:hypothetical protein POM88_051616 [Heracleum sosnowskyi]